MLHAILCLVRPRLHSHSLQESNVDLSPLLYFARPFTLTHPRSVSLFCNQEVDCKMVLLYFLLIGY